MELTTLYNGELRCSVDRRYGVEQTHSHIESLCELCGDHCHGIAESELGRTIVVETTTGAGSANGEPGKVIPTDDQPILRQGYRISFGGERGRRRVERETIFSVSLLNLASSPTYTCPHQPYPVNNYSDRMSAQNVNQAIVDCSASLISL